MNINRIIQGKTLTESNNNWVYRVISVFFLSLFLFSQTALAFQINHENDLVDSEELLSVDDSQSILKANFFDLSGNTKDFEFKDSDNNLEKDLEEKSESENKAYNLACNKLSIDLQKEINSADQFIFNLKQKRKSIPLYIILNSWKSFLY